MTDNDLVLEVNNVSKYFTFERGIFKKRKFVLKAVEDISFKLKRQQTLGVVGESGCGKTTLGKVLVNLYNIDSGNIIFHLGDKDIDITNASNEDMKIIRKSLQMVFQDPQSSLNPRWMVKDIIGEPIKILKLANSRKERENMVLDLLNEVGLKPEHMNRYPHEFSGGQRQRIGIARALASNPKIIVLDEPTSAVDVSVQAQVLNLLKKLQKDHGISYIFISHNLGVVRHMADDIMVQYLGRAVEYGASEKIFNNPMHPYTKALLSAVPTLDPEYEAYKKRIILEGLSSNAMNLPSGCSFNPRCFELVDEKKCRSQIPQLIEVEKDHKVACWRY